MKIISCPKFSKKQKAFKSQTLIEIVLSIALAAMVISALLVLGAASAKTVSASLKRSQATKLAVAGLEASRYYRDQFGFVSLNDGYYQISDTEFEPVDTSVCAVDADECFIDVNLSENFASGATGASNTFGRNIKITTPSDSGSGNFLKQVVVTVRWNTGGNNSANNYQDVTVSTILSNWNR